MSRPEFTTLLQAAAEGDRKASAAVYELAYAELKRIAVGTLRRHGAPMTLNPSTLVHEAYLRLGVDRPLNDSQHFYALLARAMRQVVVDMARARATVKHGDGLKRAELSERLPDECSHIEELLVVDQALTQLATLDPELAELVELHFFGGLAFVDIATMRGVNERTIRRHWDSARAFLIDRMAG